ncbi:unnamed protein product [Fraxinus pennsylvanica]|uniref:Uncharacterized protein n=1 Tax=Fraxinus pennsylvanica TaxID=56036 RepID=A0AAD1YXJ5_9LAMI|nr:unnamed protein product [Fraxinus pennsylvanica]
MYISWLILLSCYPFLKQSEASQSSSTLYSLFSSLSTHPPISASVRAAHSGTWLRSGVARGIFVCVVLLKSESFIGINYGQAVDNLPLSAATSKLLQSTTIEKSLLRQ